MISLLQNVQRHPVFYTTTPVTITHLGHRRFTDHLPEAGNIDEVVAVLKQVLESKQQAGSEHLNHAALLNIFKIGTSAGGARPKILISQHRTTDTIIPGDLEYSADYDHYQVKLNMDEELGYSREAMEYCYYITAIQLGITMMPSKMIEGKHFATLRFDRQAGKKQHILTASGMTGWD